MKFKLTLIFTLFIYANVNGQGFRFPAIIDTLPSINTKYIKAENKTTFERIPFYIGNYKDQIILGRYHHDVRIPISSNFIISNAQTEANYPWLPDSSINFDFNERQESILELYDHEKERYVQYHGRTLMISNKLDSTILIGYGYDVPVIMEALDKDNTWKEIETRHMYDCGVGLHYIKLRPKEIACIVIPEYKGDYKTLLRFKLKNNYSLPFKGSINTVQFNKR